MKLGGRSEGKGVFSPLALMRTARNADVTCMTRRGGGTLTMNLSGPEKSVVSVRLSLTNHSQTRAYSCPIYRLRMPDTGSASITATMPEEISYFKALYLSASSDGWGVARLSTTGGTIANPSNASRAAAVCNVFGRSIQRFEAASRAYGRAKGR